MCPSGVSHSEAHSGLREARDNSDGAKDIPPLIDMSGSNGAQRGRVSREIADACDTWGFFQVINHGVDLSLMRKASDVAKEFFKLPVAEKLKFTRHAGHFEGYHHPTLSAQVSPGLTQKLETLINVLEPNLPVHREFVPTKPTAYGPTIAEYVEAMRELSSRLLAHMSEMLGVEQDAMQKIFDSGPNGSRSSIRCLLYEPNDTDDEIALVGHTDPGGLTTVFSDEVTGLQVKKGDRWVDIHPVPNAFIINLGDMVEVLSNGRYKSAEHRGMFNKTHTRFSLIHFHSPSMDGMVSPVPGIVTDNSPAAYRTFKYGDYTRDYIGRGLVGKAQLHSIKVKSSNSQL